MFSHSGMDSVAGVCLTSFLVLLLLGLWLCRLKIWWPRCTTCRQHYRPSELEAYVASDWIYPSKCCRGSIRPSDVGFQFVGDFLRTFAEIALGSL